MKIHCPRCKCELRRKEELMRIGVNRPIACTARQCPQCRVWYPLPHKMTYIRFRPVWAVEAVAA